MLRRRHDSASPCSNKNDNPSCINCQGGHLAISHNCPMIIRHKMILSLAALENIPLIEAKQKIIQGTTVPKDIVYDYNNFPLLSTSKSNNGSSNSYQSHNQTSNIPQYNRFSILNTFNNSEDMPESSFAYSPSSNAFYRNNKPSFLHMVSRSRDKTKSHSQKSLQKNDYNFISHNNLLYSPDNRSSNMFNNGVSYSNHPLNDPCNEDINSLSLNFPSHETHGNAISNNFASNNDNNNSNINIVSLNNAILSLSKNIEFIYNLVRSA